MLTRKEKALLYDPYFEVIREDERLIEVKSVNTGHCWSLFRNEYDTYHKITLYHKHKESDPHFHQHRLCKNRAEAVEQIKAHDEYVLAEAKRKAEEAGLHEGQSMRKLTVQESSGYQYKPTPTIKLKGDWLRDLGFAAGDKVNVVCEYGKLVITPTE